MHLHEWENIITWILTRISIYNHRMRWSDGKQNNTTWKYATSTQGTEEVSKKGYKYFTFNFCVKEVSKKGDNYMRSDESKRSFVCQLQLSETVCLGAYKSEGWDCTLYEILTSYQTCYSTQLSGDGWLWIILSLQCRWREPNFDGACEFLPHWCW